jgi:CheY-like chemotaxis protein
MQEPPEILIVDDDQGHALLVQNNLLEAGLNNPILFFCDGQEILNFLYGKGSGPKMQSGKVYLILLDIRMPKIDGIEVLEKIKGDPVLKKIPVVMLTTTDDPREVERCHRLGCNIYIQKPVDYDKFSEAIRKLGGFITLLLIPPIDK